MELEEHTKLSFRLSQKHINFLSAINSNQTKALRSALDELIEIKKNKKKDTKAQRLNNNIIIFSLGALFLLFSVFSTNVAIGYIATLFGIFLVANGVIGGILTEIRRTK